MLSRRNTEACVGSRLAGLAVCIALLAISLAARLRAKAPQISVQVDVVTVPVTVTDARGEFVQGLSRANFRLFVDGAEQPIEYFAAESEPARVLVLVETGPAVYLLRREHLSAAGTLLGGLGPADRVAIASYSDAPQLLLNFTADKQEATAALGSLSYGLGMAQLNFYDCLAATLEWTGAEAGNKRAIVVLTTGLDSSGTGHIEALEGRLRKSNVIVLPVALGEELRAPTKNSKKQVLQNGQQVDVLGDFAAWDHALEEIAATTGGHAFFPRSAKDFDQDYRRIASLLRHQYSLGFAPAQHDGGVHSIQVEVVNGQGEAFDGKTKKSSYGVNARREFLAPGP